MGYSRNGTGAFMFVEESATADTVLSIPAPEGRGISRIIRLHKYSTQEKQVLFQSDTIIQLGNAKLSIQRLKGF
jgi:hypothetical protein